MSVRVRGGGGLPWSTTAEVAAEQARLGRWLHGQFWRKLSGEDCADVAAEAICELEGLLRALEPVRHPERLLQRIARHRALDAVRSLQGEAASGPRRPAAPIEPGDELLADQDRPFDPVETAAALAQGYEDLARAMDALPEGERTVLALRHVDGLPAGTVAGLLGLSLPQYERLHTRAIKSLRARLVDSARDASCHGVRKLVDREPVPVLDALRRDAHLAGCLPCTAYARARREPALGRAGLGRGTLGDVAPQAA